MKGGYKLELGTPETMQLFGNKDKLIDKTKNKNNVPSQVVQVVLVHCNLENNQYQQKSEVFILFLLINRVHIC